MANAFIHPHQLRASDYVNSTIDPAHKIRYCALDYSHISKHRNLDVSASLNEVSTWAVNQTGFFCSSPRWKIAAEGVVEPFTEADGLGAERLSQRLGVPVFPMEQNGALRTNCIEYVLSCLVVLPFAYVAIDLTSATIVQLSRSNKRCPV
jgi:hypothetical protein